MRRTATVIVTSLALTVGAIALGACGSSSKSNPSNQPGVTTDGGTPTTVSTATNPPTTAATSSGGGGYGYG